MDKITATRAGLAIIIFVMGSLQAWDSDVPAAGLLIVTAAQEPKQHPATDMSLTTPERL